MKVIVSQQNKRVKITFQQNGFVDNYEVDKADDFLAAIDRVVKLWQSRQRRLKSLSRPKFYYPVDKFVKKRKIKSIGQIRHIEFVNTGLLTERVIRAIIRGLRFSTPRVVPRRGKINTIHN